MFRLKGVRDFRYENTSANRTVLIVEFEIDDFHYDKSRKRRQINTSICIIFQSLTYAVVVLLKSRN